MTLEDHVPDLILNPLNKELTALNKLETNRMNNLHRHLSTVIKVKVRNSVQRGASKEVQVVREVLKYCVTILAKTDVNMRELVDLIKEPVILIDTEAPLFKAALAREKKSTLWKLEGDGVE
nr:hypothetical protein [Tanacetum cinerariifolium]